MPGWANPKIASMLLGALVASSPGAVFEDVTRRLLPDDPPAEHGHLRFEGLVDAIGSGLAVFDYDRDGRLDVYLPGAESPFAGLSFLNGGSRVRGRLLRQTPSGALEDRTRGSGIDAPPGATGTAAADVDGDGWTDLVVTGHGGTRFFRNRNGSFTDETAASGIVGPAWGTTALFFDADGDGRADLLLPSYVEYDPKYRVYFKPDGFPSASAYLAARPILMRNEGGGKFSDATRQMGLDVPMRALGALAADADGDGRLDLYFACDGSASALFLRREQGFERAPPAAGVNYGQKGEGATMHCPVLMPGPSLLVTDETFGAFFVPSGKSAYDDRTVALGLAEAVASAPSWGAAAGDFDADGELDLFVARGGFRHPQPADDRFLKGRPDGSFADATDRAGSALRHRAVSRACVAVDFDGDGALDVLESGIDRPLRVLKGSKPEANRTLVVKLRSKNPIGARVEVTAGGRTWTRQVTAGGFLSSAPPDVHFGLGAVDAIESLKVTWPSGKTESVPVEGLPAKRAGSGAVGPSYKIGQASGDSELRDSETGTAAVLPAKPVEVIER